MGISKTLLKFREEKAFKVEQKELSKQGKPFFKKKKNIKKLIKQAEMKGKRRAKLQTFKGYLEDVTKSEILPKGRLRKMKI